MTEEDMFFTHTIVGTALSLPLGTVPTHTAPAKNGLQINMRDASTTLDQTWKDWVLLQGAYPYIGRPRPVPGAFRRRLERYALLIATAGILLCLVALAQFLGVFNLPIFSQ
jgi:hypothetical protein